MKFTNSTIFLLRGLELIKPTETIDESALYTKLNFVNAYIRDKNKDEDYDSPLYLLFKPTELAMFKDFVDGEYDIAALKEDYDYPNGRVVLVYDFPLIYREDYQKIVAGQYSLVSKEFKDLFPENYRERGIKYVTLTHHIFTKSKQLQIQRETELGLEEGFLDGAELWSPFNIENETLDIDKIVENDRHTENKEGVSEEL